MRISPAETTRQIKATLGKKFPACKFSVTRGGESITWPDDGPTRVEVEDAIIATRLVEIQNSYDNKRYLRLPTGSIWLDRYNVAERAAQQQDLERRIAERQEERERTEAAIAAARQVKCEAITALRHCPSELDDSRLQAAYGAFDTLRERAEAAVRIEQERDRRPSWAPPLTLDGELLELCQALGYLADDAAPIARLWAGYADPKRSRGVLRETKSTLPLAGFACRGFQLFAGGERGNTSELLFEAQRTETGAWRFGPTIYTTGFFSPSGKWEQLSRALASAEYTWAKYGADGYAHLPAQIAKLKQQLAEIDAQDLAGAHMRRKYSEQRTRALQQAQQRVLEFVGAPDAQMQLAARLWGHCCICGKALTDPISLERGVGPDCYARRVNFVRAYAATQSIEWITCWSGMPREFVVAVINEARVA